MSFYQECLGGELSMMTVGESPMADMMPDATDKILHAILRKDSVVIMASDMMEPGQYVQGNTVSLSITCSAREEMDDLWKKLSEGGTVGHQLSEQFFGTIGDFKDKFGFQWLVVLLNPEAA